MHGHELTKKWILDAVWEAQSQRIRPIELERIMGEEHDMGPRTVKIAVQDLIYDGELEFTYYDPCSYVAIAGSERHRAARPLKVIPDWNGEYFICDSNVDPNGDLEKQGGWRCGDLAFSASD